MIDWTTIWRFLTATDERTWVGHGLQGLLFGFLGGSIRSGNGVFFTLGAFGHREADDYLRWTRRVRLLRVHFSKAERRAKMVDGFMDLWSPMVGAFAGEILAELIRP